jgi:U4/U6 small nuclear ribonucleoprotein PRP3
MFKVNINAEQYNLTGGIVSFEGRNLVIVEGGPRNTRKYTRLMLERIKWNGDSSGKAQEEDDEDIDEDMDADMESSASSNAHCILLWKAVNNRRLFPHFKTYACPNEMIARKVLADKGLSHLWELAANPNVLPS